MIDPELMLEEFLFSPAPNIATAMAVGLLIVGIAQAVPRAWKWWAAFPLAVLIGLCATIAFITLGMRLLYKLGASFPVYFGPIQFGIAILVSGAGYAMVRKLRGPASTRDVPKPDSWYDPR